MKVFSIDKTILEHESDEIGQSDNCVKVIELQDEMVITKAQALGVYTTLMPQWLNRESMYYDDIKELLRQIGERFNL